jgi:DNA-binding transcriptional regulator of glucitol operon
VSKRWLSFRALCLHLAVLTWVAGCAAATWWQVGRAVGGNQFSYLYAVEWPVFAVAGAFCWWALVHADDTPETAQARTQAMAERRAALESHVALRNRVEEDAELAAYNDHLAALATSGRRKSWRT